MKIILLSLPGLEENDGPCFPLGIGYLVGALKKNHQVEAYHFQKMAEARKAVRERVAFFKPQLVGLTCSTFNRGFVKEMIGIIKDLDNAIKIVVGGVHASFCCSQMLEQYGADVIVIGEGEVTIAELCLALETGASLDSVNGIAYLVHGAVKLNPPREVIYNLDELPIPDYTYARPFIESTGMGFLITSRGCPVRCTFCSTSSFWGQKVRMNSVSRVVDEMEMMLSNYRVRKIFFEDDTFNLGIGRVKEICNEILRRNINVEWGCSCRVSPVSEEMIALMVKAGCRHICWGVESGSEEMLRRIDKKITLTQVKNAFELSKKFSDVMSTGAFTMVGNPGETKETIQDTINFLNTISITDRPSTSTLYVLPGTLLYEETKKKGFITDADWYTHDTVPYYTIENSHGRMQKWAKMISASGDIIQFDHEKHFWNGILTTSEDSVGAESKLSKIIKRFNDSKKIVSMLKKRMPAGKIRF
jgi:radical SAM superfamily enzyme YgiQ (UPF0313 family)